MSRTPRSEDVLIFMLGQKKTSEPVIAKVNISEHASISKHNA